MYYNDSLQLTNYYNKKGELTSVTDSLSSANVTCVYNSLGQMTSYTEKQGNSTKIKQAFTYDEYGNTNQMTLSGGVRQTYKYSYDDLSDRRFNGMSFGGATSEVTYDNLDRIKTKKVTYNGTEVYTKTYDYRDVKHSSTQTNATNQPKSIVYTKGTSTKQNIQYTYYDMTGKLSGITVNGKNIEYYYDYDKLRRENNQLLNASFVKYCYDSGNISKDIKGDYKSRTAVISNSSSTSYSYDGDRMMSFGNQACEYDNMGNPTTYRGKSATWKGRQLTQLGNTKFTYDGQGRRISKNSLTFLYDGNGNIIKQSNGLEFFYDFEGIAALKRNNTMYFFLRDGQGNIIAIVDSTGDVVVQYWYDAWGNHKVVDADGDEITDQNNIGNLNPFRYRGYYYDTETGLYFLQTRYYDPEVGRFLNRDSVEYADPETINGLNLYAYCLNNPVEYVDPDGHSVLAFLAAAIVGFTVSFASSAVTQAIFNGGQVNWGIAAIDGLFGAVSGLLTVVPGLGAVATGFINAGLTALNGVITTGIENDWQYSLQDGITIAISSIMSGVGSGITRNRFIKNGGFKVLTDTHKFVGTVSKRIVTGYYNNGFDIFSKSFRSAAKQMFGKIMSLNFGTGFYKDWLSTLSLTIFSTSFLRGLNIITNGL